MTSSILKVVYLREAKVLDEVDGWLAAAFGPHSLGLTIAAMTERMIDPDEAPLIDLRERMSKCDRKLSQYGSALDAAGNLIEIFSWINKTKNTSACLEKGLKAASAVQPFNGAEISSMFEEIGEVVRLVGEADPGDKTELYLRLSLKLTYYPEKQCVEAEVESGPESGRSVCFRARLRARPGKR